MEKSYPHSGTAGNMSRAYIALGSNIGKRADLLAQALKLLDGSEGVAVEEVSSAYETDPVGYADQPAFLNMAASLRTRLDPLELLRLMLDIERRLGRVRDIRNGPRTIDLDLLLYEDVFMDKEELQLPHPRMEERAFVMVPLAEVLEPGHPLLAKAESMAVAALRDGKEGIAQWNTINWRSGSAPLGS
ncbi:2-amino-4-hydroxy-6-hydroxymethyldihydropteridine diphosphokinase [Paenibacillus sp. D51F]